MWTNESCYPGGARYFLTFIDDFSRFTFVYLIKEKSEVIDKFKDFLHFVKNQYGKSIKVLRSDNGGEYVSNEFSNLLRNNGIKHETTIPYTPEQNGVAERKNRSLQEMANCMLFIRIWIRNFREKVWLLLIMFKTDL